jgi:L-alanine-DL-glutamate epimerase-like enolase superfamily enzyme
VAERTASVRIVTARERALPIASAIANAYISFASMTVSTLALISDVVRDGAPLVGFGFNSNGRYAQSGILRERFIPRLLAADPDTLLDSAGTNFDPSRVWDALMRDEKPGGHGERSVAVGVIDMAIWDLVAKIARQPLHRLLAERHGTGPPDERVSVYAAGGYYAPDKDRTMLVDEMAGYLDRGYTEVKLKIGGASLDEDLRRIEAVAGLMPTVGIAVDANGRFDMRTALAYAEALEPYGLLWFEEPGDPLDFLLQATLGEVYGPPLATGENLFSAADARNLLRYGGMRPDRDVLQFDPALSYGLTEFLRTLDVLRAHGWSPRRVIPHGGHQFALAIAAGLGLGGNESYPGVFEPFGGFADSTPIVDGHVVPCEVPGIGVERNTGLYAVLRELL